MLNYLQKYNNLSQELRDKMSAPKAMAAIEDLEKKHELNLAAVIMKIMIKEIDVNNLAVNLASEFSINKNKAEQLANDLKEKILSHAADYLDIKIKPKKVRAIMPKLSVKEESAAEVRNEPLAQAVDPLFSPEDEEEIKRLAKKINGDIKKVKLSDEQIELNIDGAVAEARINFGSDLLAVRFRQILKTYFRGIRDRISAKQALVKHMELGGLGFDNDSAEKALKIADKRIKNLNEFKPDITKPERIKTPDLQKEKLDSFKDSGVRDIDYDLSTLKKSPDIEIDNIKKSAEIKKTINKLDTKHELAPPPPAISRIKPNEQEPVLRKEQKNKLSLSKIKNVLSRKALGKSIVEKAGEFAAKKKGVKPEQKISMKKTAEKQTAKEQIHKIKQVDARRVDETMGKIKMDDVKFIPRSMGPVDELRYMDLVNFRRLCKTPEEIIHKIKEKINLLEEESYVKRLDGIKAWRKSPVNKVYLEIGHESINEKKPVSIIIEERKAKGMDYLNNQEFEAITDLNKDLRF